MSSPSGPEELIELKQYRLVRELGRGAMGIVYVATDNRTGATVAIKVLNPSLAGSDPTFRERFEREAHIAALLRSPYTVHVLDFGVAGSAYYLAMEFIDGSNLRKELEAGPMDPKQALQIASQVARALEEAGARGVVHRDIKPENILLTAEGRVKVADFGIARQEGGSHMTTVGSFVGTPAYAAPEQALGEADHRSDIYSLGATLFCMLTGHPPFQGTSPWEVMRKHQRGQVPMHELDNLPDAVTNPVRRCLEKDPRDRYQSASELAGALERALASLTQPTSTSDASPAAGSTPAGSTPSVRVPPAAGAATIIAPQGGAPAPQGGAPATQGGAPATQGGAPAPQAPPVATPSAPVPPPVTPYAPPPAPPPAAPPEAATAIAPRSAGAPPPAGAAPVRVSVGGAASPQPRPMQVSLALSPAGSQAAGTMRYVVTAWHDGSGEVPLRLVFQEASGLLAAVAMPPVVAGPAASPGQAAFDVRQVRPAGRGTGPLAFRVTAISAAGQPLAYADGSIVPAGPGSGSASRIVLIAGVAAVGVGGLVAMFALTGGGSESSTATPTAGPTSGGTGETAVVSPSPGGTGTAAGIPALPRSDFKFTVATNNCPFGASQGSAYELAFRFEPATAGATVHRDGDRVKVVALQDREIVIGTFPFRAAGFEFGYQVSAADGRRGEAKLRATFAADGSIAAATVEETYADPGCVIQGKMGG